MPDIITARRLAEIKERISLWGGNFPSEEKEPADLAASYERAVELLREYHGAVSGAEDRACWSRVRDFLKEFDQPASTSTQCVGVRRVGVRSSTNMTDNETRHYSDCAVHNVPALPVGPCGCSWGAGIDCAECGRRFTPGTDQDTLCVHCFEKPGPGVRQ